MMIEATGSHEKHFSGCFSAVCPCAGAGGAILKVKEEISYE